MRIIGRRETCDKCGEPYPTYYMNSKRITYFDRRQNEWKERFELWCADCSIHENYRRTDEERLLADPPPREDYLPAALAIRQPPGRFGPSPLLTYMEKVRSLKHYSDVSAFEQALQNAASSVGMPDRVLSDLISRRLDQVRKRKIAATSIPWRRRLLRDVQDWLPTTESKEIRVFRPARLL